MLDDDGKIVALIGNSEDGFDLLGLPDNMARTPSGRLACRFETSDFSSVGGVPLVLWDNSGVRDPVGSNYGSQEIDYSNLTEEEFVQYVYADAKREQQVSGVPAAITTAQAILETGFGKYVPTDIYTGQYSFNLFGIKGTGPAGSVSCYTQEVYDGERVSIIAQFKAYHSFAESISGRTQFFRENNRYHFLFETSDPNEWADGLQKAGYATDPNYASLLKQIIKEWGLK